MSEFVVYSGTGPSSVDAKGRLTIPADLRNPVQQSSGGNEVYLGRDIDLPCLIGFGKGELIEQRIEQDRLRQAANQRGEKVNPRAALGGSVMHPMSFEPSGRFVLHPTLVGHASLQPHSRVFFVGAITHFYIWNADVFAAEAPEDFAHFRGDHEYYFGASGKGRK